MLSTIDIETNYKTKVTALNGNFVSQSVKSTFSRQFFQQVFQHPETIQ